MVAPTAVFTQQSRDRHLTPFSGMALPRDQQGVPCPFRVRDPYSRRNRPRWSE
jgi:hypothetical protein